MSQSINYDALFAAAEAEVREKARELRQAEREYVKCNADYFDAKSELAKHQKAWEDAGMPEVPDDELAEARQKFDARQDLYASCERSLSDLRKRLAGLRYKVELRRMLDMQPWYVSSVVAGGVLFVFAVGVSFFIIRSFWWNIGPGIGGFVVGFLLLCWCQTIPEAILLDRSIAELVSQESDLRERLAPALENMEAARIPFARLSELHDLKAQVCVARIVLSRCNKELSIAAAIHERVQGEYDDTKRSCSRRRLLISSDWRSLRGTEFEAFLAEVFRELGYDVQTTKASGDHGVDLVIRKGKSKVAVQAKGYPKTTVGNSAIQEVYLGMKIYGCERCAVVTNSFFTAHASEAAGHADCLLIDQARIEELICGKISGLN